MFLKNILRGAALCSLLAISSTKFAEAKYTENSGYLSDLRYSIGVAGGFGLFEFNESTFQSDRVDSRPGFTVEELRTTYKYVDNFPTKTLHFDFNITKSFKDIKVKDYSFFFGTEFDFGLGKINPTKGLTNPNADYMSAGSTMSFYALNTKFGLENKNYKVYGIAGLMYGDIDVPFDIVVPGASALMGGLSFGPLQTCTVFKPGSSLLAEVNIGSDLTFPQTLINSECAKIQVQDTSVKTWFVNLGAGFETILTKNLSFMTEYIYMIQLSKGKIQNFEYTYNGVPYTFSGKMGILNSQYLKVGLRYYFN